MARVVCINDYEAYARMIAAMLELKGHAVKAEIVPVSIEEIVAFAPDVLILSLVRKPETISAGGMHNFYTDVEGARALKELSEATELRDIPIIITSIAVLESELPADVVRYKAFLEVPQKLEALDSAIVKLANANRHGEHVASE